MFQPTEQEIRAFVGSKSDYYLSKWQVELEGDGEVKGLNWAALLLSGLWLPYRKMYRPAIIFMGLILIEMILEEVIFVAVLRRPDPPAALGRFVGLVAGGICGAFGNRWYLSHARKMIEEVRSQNLPEEDHLRVLSERGGTRPC
ncbi:DUF2628 domain-containing protein [Limnoglobus roseus]|uniref:DUF2628 domain-containing protein n=1 Tax=Limnoglobus roseus TaxID=2598579 RepID=A0A5C1AHU5_9BACT|nr:DUF2628 domain-containing protein [Limnoglobus roseus]QEL19009.1 hypothetical protein PX52LOC_06059 [Limnoglobus roseus]